MKGYLVKYALTAGIYEVKAAPTSDSRYVSVSLSKGSLDIFCRVGRDFFQGRGEAEAAAKKLAQKKVASLTKQLAAVRALANTPRYFKKAK